MSFSLNKLLEYEKTTGIGSPLRRKIYAVYQHKTNTSHFDVLAAYEDDNTNKDLWAYALTNLGEGQGTVGKRDKIRDTHDTWWFKVSDNKFNWNSSVDLNPTITSYDFNDWNLVYERKTLFGHETDVITTRGFYSLDGNTMLTYHNYNNFLSGRKRV